MPARVSMDEAVRRVAALPPGALVGIDGLPVAGKSTLADRLVGELGFAGIFLDDFVRPEADWPAGRQPAFPFPYIRYDDFVATVKAMALRRTATFSPYDWTAGKLAEPRTVTFGRGVVIEGVSALLPDLSPLYSLSIFVESDRPTVLAAARFRGVGNWDAEWREWFLPSADLYFATNPPPEPTSSFRGAAHRQSVEDPCGSPLLRLIRLHEVLVPQDARSQRLDQWS